MHGTVHLLVVDAAGRVDGTVARIESTLDATVDRTSTVEAALDHLDDDVDCVVTGHDLDAGDGLAVIEAVRERRPSLPVLLFADVDDDVAHAAVAAGVTDHVRRDKPDATAVLAARIERAVERARREQVATTLHAATRDLMEARTPEAVGEIGVRTAREVLDMPLSTLFLHDESRGVLYPAVNADETAELFGEPPTMDIGQGIAGDAFVTGSVEVHADGQRDERAHSEGSNRIRSYVVFPLGEHGVLSVSSQVVDAFDENDVELGKILAANMEAALDRAEREQELADKNERLEEFASIVSHDLRNPLTVARGNLELVREDVDREELARIDDALARMDDLVDGLLSLAREGRDIADTAPVSVASVATRAWRAVDSADATLRLADPGVVEADPDRLQELFENLLRNAREHGPGAESGDSATDGGVLTVTVGALDDGEGFYVADDGVGIPAAERDRVFERGYSGTGGTGIGLAIVRRIAEAHGWSPTVRESDGGGARFEFHTG